MRLKLLLLGIVLGFGFSSAPAYAADTPGSFEAPVWVPLRDSSKDKPLELQITVNVNGKPVTKNVKVETITKWVRTGAAQGETIPMWHQRLTRERGAASQEKAKQIAAAINTAFVAEFQQLGQQATTETYRRRDPETALQGDFGMFIIPGVLEAQKQPFVVVKEPTGELGGTGGRFRPGVTPSMGAMGSMSLNRLLTDSAFLAEGYDPLGDPSVVQLGIDEFFVATLMPQRGMTDEEILMALELILDSNDLPATYDRSLLTLFLNDPIPTGQTFIWGYSDPGLDFRYTLEGLNELPQVPEPASLGLLFAGFLAVGLAGRSAPPTLRD